MFKALAQTVSLLPERLHILLNRLPVAVSAIDSNELLRQSAVCV
jgi:hypothetical protein